MSRIAGFSSRLTVVLLALMVAAAASSCGKKQESTENTTTTEPGPDTSAMATPTPELTDANIAAIVVAANDVDIKGGQMAKSESKNPAVKAFAEQMITDHTSVNKQAGDLAKRISLNPEDNDLSKQLQESAGAMRDSIKTRKGAAFDKAYIDNEVAYHEAVISMLDSKLIPGAQNPELKSLLENVRPSFEAHLEHAKKVQSSLNP